MADRRVAGDRERVVENEGDGKRIAVGRRAGDGDERSRKKSF